MIYGEIRSLKLGVKENHRAVTQHFTYSSGVPP